MTTLAKPKAPPITIGQYLAFEPPAGFRDELIEGEIVVSPEPKPLHHDIALNVFRLLENSVSESFKVGMRINMRIEAENSMPSPDVFVLERSRWRSALENDSYPESSPLLAIEIISPGNRRTRVDQKVALYLRNGSFSVWAVYPKKRIVKVHEPGKDPILLRAGDSVSPGGPLSNVRLAVADIFSL